MLLKQRLNETESEALVIPLSEFVRQYAGVDNLERQQAIYKYLISIFDFKDAEVIHLFTNENITIFGGFEYRLDEIAYNDISVLLERKGM